MDLRGCMLATLSACETGLGEIKGSEGVFGLQRAFKMAGVQNLIVILWQVPDKTTTEFMETFYKKWLINKLELREAFRQTQQEMSRKYKPYQWAAFVLVE
jgi:CHAT domain-containing protein